MRDLDEALHVYDSHTARKLWAIMGEESIYTKAQLLEIIGQAREEIERYQENWLIPILSELEEMRGTK